MSRFMKRGGLFYFDLPPNVMMLFFLIKKGQIRANVKGRWLISGLSVVFYIFVMTACCVYFKTLLLIASFFSHTLISLLVSAAFGFIIKLNIIPFDSST
jgi:hypothetical protein